VAEVELRWRVYSARKQSSGHGPWLVRFCCWNEGGYGRSELVIDPGMDGLVVASHEISRSVGKSTSTTPPIVHPCSYREVEVINGEGFVVY
jgi:hypothetical protein